MRKLGYGFLVCCFAAILSPAALRAQDEPTDNLTRTVQDVLEEAKAALESGDFATARDNYSALIKDLKRQNTLQNLAPLYVARAKAYIGLGEKEKALEDFSEAEREAKYGDPLNPADLFLRGKLMMDYSSQFYGAALSDLKAAYDSNPDNPEYAYHLGKIYALVSPNQQAAHLAPEANELLSAHLEQNPNDAEALRLRGQALATMKKFEEAEADIRRSVELEPENHEAHFAVGVIRLQQEDYPGAIAGLQKAIEFYTPEEEDTSGMPYAQAYLLLASVYEDYGKQSDDKELKEQAFNGSIQTCDTLLGLLPEEDTQQSLMVKLQTYFRKGVSQRLLGQFALSRVSLTQAININPEFEEGYFRRAIVFTEMGEGELALRDLEAAQALRFEDARYYLWEGITYAQMGQYREAIRAYNEAISFSNRYVDAFRNRGHAYYQLDEFNQAINNFNECIRLEPTDPSHLFKRGVCYLQIEEPQKAERSFVYAVQVDDKYKPALEQLVSIYEGQGNSQLADVYRQKLTAANAESDAGAESNE